MGKRPRAHKVSGSDVTHVPGLFCYPCTRFAPGFRLPISRTRYPASGQPHPAPGFRLPVSRTRYPASGDPNAATGILSQSPVSQQPVSGSS